MPYFKHPQTGLHFLDSVEHIGMLTPGCEPISDEHAQIILQAQAAEQASVPPLVVTPLQAFAALEQFGLLPAALAYIDAPTTPPLVRLAWLGATEFRRDSLLVMNAALVLGLTDTTLDALFLAAAAVNA